MHTTHTSALTYPQDMNMSGSHALSAFFIPLDTKITRPIDIEAAHRRVPRTPTENNNIVKLSAAVKKILSQSCKTVLQPLNLHSVWPTCITPPGNVHLQMSVQEWQIIYAFGPTQYNMYNILCWLLYTNCNTLHMCQVGNVIPIKNTDHQKYSQ